MPDIFEHEVFNIMRAVNCTKSVVPRDMPSRLSKEFAAELATPATMIYRPILQQTVHTGIEGVWPDSWKIEYGSLRKVNNPINEDDLRIISLTNHLTKFLKTSNEVDFVVYWTFD